MFTEKDLFRADSLFISGQYEEAAALFAAGARENNTRASFNYAYCLQYGFGVPQDVARAVRIYEYLQNEEEGDAAYNLGAMYVSGRGVPFDPEKGFDYMRKAADAGCAEARLYVAMVYLTGCVGEPDIPGMRRIPFHRPDVAGAVPLIESNDVPDETMNDRRFSVVDADERETVNYLKSAAGSDPEYAGAVIGDAEFLLAKCAEEGFGGARDHDKAVTLLLRAAEDGSEAAAVQLRTLPPYEVEKARKRLKTARDAEYEAGAELRRYLN